MPKNDYIWTFNSAALIPGLNGPFSFEYHVPKLKLKVAPDELLDSRLWLVIRISNENFLYGFLSPTSIERYEEGSYKNDFLLASNPFSSIRFLPRDESHAPWLLPSFSNEEELRECTDAEQSLLLETLNRNYRVSFSPPSSSVLGTIPKTIYQDLEHAVPDQLMNTLRAVSFGDISRSQSFPSSLSAIGGVALSVLRLANPKLDTTEAVNLLTALDPLPAKTGTRQKTAKEAMEILSTLPPLVDTFLQEIDPEKIVPRTFVSHFRGNSSDWLNKTNDAEENHERILKDVVLYMKSKGLKVFKSRSFDLFTEIPKKGLLWEIKSANSQNSVSQGEKGIIQLLRYAIALSDRGSQAITFILLLQFSAEKGVLRYLSKMAKSAGVELWFYDEKRNWPNRIFNLESEVFPIFASK